jgi:hypothetical protein
MSKRTHFTTAERRADSTTRTGAITVPAARIASIIGNTVRHAHEIPAYTDVGRWVLIDLIRLGGGWECIGGYLTAEEHDLLRALELNKYIPFTVGE